MNTYKLKSFSFLVLVVGLFVFSVNFSSEASVFKGEFVSDVKNFSRQDTIKSIETPPIIATNFDQYVSKSKKGQVLGVEAKAETKELHITKLTGTLKEIVFEPNENSKNSSDTKYVLNTKDIEFIPLISTLHNLKNYKDSKVQVEGTWDIHSNFIVSKITMSKANTIGEIVRKEIEVLDTTGQPTNTESFGPPATIGDHSVLFILANFSNDTSTPIAPTDIRNTLYYNTDSANNYYKYVSKQRFELKGIQRQDIDITNWVTLPNTNANCEANETGLWTNNAYALARAQGFEPNNYRSVVLLFPAIQNCTLSTAFASIGQLGATTGTGNVWLLYSSQHMIPRALNSTFIHEIGHNLGLQHANGIQNCQTTMSFYPQGCQDFEYGDSFSIMGQTGDVLRSFNNFNLVQLGWLSSLGKVANIIEPGTYNVTLQAPILPTKGYQVVSFPLKNSNGTPTGQSAYLEFRRQVLPFEYLTRDPNQNVDRGVSIRFGPTNLSSIEKTYLLDFHQSTWWLADAAIEVGETYTNSTFGFSITPLTTHPSRGAQLRLQLTR